MSQASLSCLTCKALARYRRGCCGPCQVQAGSTTWAELERRGLAAPAQAKGRKWMAGFDRWMRAGKG